MIMPLYKFLIENLCLNKFMMEKNEKE